MKTHLFLIVLFISSLASANSIVVCGTSAVWEDFSVEGFELMLSSEYDEYNGPVGKTWNLKLGSEDAPWIENNKFITAKTVNREDRVEVQITIVIGNSIGPVGVRYVLDDIMSEEPTLKKYNMGGFTGNIETGTFKCVTAHD